MTSKPIEAGQVLKIAYTGPDTSYPSQLPKSGSQEECKILDQDGELYFYFGQQRTSVFELNFNPHFSIID